MPRFPDFLRIATATPLEEDYMDIARDGTVIYTPEKELIFLFSKFLNFNYTLVVPKDEVSGLPLKNGSWTGIYGLLQRNEADLSFDLSSIFEEKTKVVDFSYPFYSSRLTFLTQKPRPLPKSLNIFHPFSGNVWVTLIVFIFLFSLLFYVINRGERSYVATFFQTLKSSLSQSFDNLQLTSISQRFIYGGWILGITVLIYGYSSTLLSFLLATPTKGITTIPELASAVADGSVKCRTHKGSYNINALMESDLESHRIIGKALYENSKESRIEDMYTDPNSAQITAFISSEDDFGLVKNTLFISEDSFFSEMYAVSMRKKFCCKEKINKMVRRMVSGGLFEKMLKDNYARCDIIEQALNPSPTPPENETLKLEDLSGAFIILIIGLSGSFLVFLGEILVYKISRFFENRKTSEIGNENPPEEV